MEVADGDRVEPRLGALDSLDSTRFEGIDERVLERVLGAFTITSDAGECSDQTRPRGLDRRFPLVPLQLRSPVCYVVGSRASSCLVLLESPARAVAATARLPRLLMKRRLGASGSTGLGQLAGPGPLRGGLKAKHQMQRYR